MSTACETPPLHPLRSGGVTAVSGCQRPERDSSRRGLVGFAVGEVDTPPVIPAVADDSARGYSVSRHETGPAEHSSEPEHVGRSRIPLLVPHDERLARTMRTVFGCALV